MSEAGSSTDPFRWGYIPPARLEPAQREALVRAEQAALGDLIRSQHGICAACQFPAARALRGYRPPGPSPSPWVGVCPVCLAGLDLTRAPHHSPLLYLPELSPPVFSRMVHSVFALYYSDDPDLADTADLTLDALRPRQRYLTEVLDHWDMHAGLLCETYWTLSEEQQAGVQRLMSGVRVLINREDLGEVLDHWRVHSYPRWAAGSGA